MSDFEVVPHVSRTTQQPHPHAPGHYVESTHVDMWAIRDVKTQKIVDTHWHKESAENVARWHNTPGQLQNTHPCQDKRGS